MLQMTRPCTGVKAPCGLPASFGSRPCRRSAVQQHQQLHSRRVLVRAEADSDSDAEQEQQTSIFADPSGQLAGSLEFTKDTETFQDVFAFAGELPERVNGRVAMWSFAALVLAEVQTGKSTLEQAVAHPISALTFSILISIASLMPKFASGVSLKELHGAASRESLPKVLAFFNKTHELWLGRVAMIGLVGLVAVEAVRHAPLF